MLGQGLELILDAYHGWNWTCCRYSVINWFLTIVSAGTGYDAGTASILVLHAYLGSNCTCCRYRVINWFLTFVSVGTGSAATASGADSGRLSRLQLDLRCRVQRMELILGACIRWCWIQCGQLPVCS
jgi:hypothetical protein